MSTTGEWWWWQQWRQQWRQRQQQPWQQWRQQLYLFGENGPFEPEDL